MSLLRAGAAALCLLATVACGGPEDTLTAYDVSMVTLTDCSQVGQGGINCEDAEQLSQVTRTGRWILDHRGVDTFVLTTEDGKSVAGVYFANNCVPGDPNTVCTPACQGEGGSCHFARTRFTTVDPATGCAQETQRIVDSRVVDDQLVGLFIDLTVTEETCEVSLITQVEIQVTGTLSEEAVVAREGVQ
jgi:hypothetical protein